MEKTYEIKDQVDGQVICRFASDEKNASDIFKKYWCCDDYIIFCVTDNKEVTDKMLNLQH